MFVTSNASTSLRNALHCPSMNPLLTLPKDTTWTPSQSLICRIYRWKILALIDDTTAKRKTYVLLMSQFATSHYTKNNDGSYKCFICTVHTKAPNNCYVGVWIYNLDAATHKFHFLWNFRHETGSAVCKWGNFVFTWSRITCPLMIFLVVWVFRTT